MLSAKTIKQTIYTLLFVGISGCTLVDSTHFTYLDDENLVLQQILISGADKDVEISLPRSLAEKLPDRIKIGSEQLQLPYIKVLDFPYEWLWGGPAHKDKGLFLIELAFLSEKNRAYLEENINFRIQSIRQHYEDFDEGEWREYVLENLVLYKYESQQGYWWVMDNKPTVMRHHEQFSLPISNRQLLIVWFWYNEDWAKENPDWFERRKALSRRILDTVTVSNVLKAKPR